jgi:membrane protease YdiL (CAAX protease family)
LFYQFVWGKSGTGIPTNPAVILNCVMEGLAFVAMLVGARLIRLEGNNRLGFSKKNILPGLVIGIVGIIVAWPVVQLTGDIAEFVLQHLQKPHPSAHELLLSFKSADHGWVRWMVILSAVVIAPLAEETFFRAFLQTWVRASLKNPWVAILISSALFAATHEWWTQPSIFIFGLCLGYLYERTGNLWANIFLHALFNGISIASYWWYINHGG